MAERVSDLVRLEGGLELYAGSDSTRVKFSNGTVTLAVVEWEVV